MANTVSAQKNHRKSLRRNAINRARVGRIRSFVKKVEHALTAGDQAAAAAALREAQPEIDRGVTKGVIHKNTASRKISRLTAALRKLGGATA